MTAAKAILQGKPDWTALVDDTCGGYVVTVGGDIFFCDNIDGPGHLYSKEDLGQFDSSAWNDRSWDGVPVKECRAILERPVFKILAFR
jgi:hypothetical protein